MAIERITMHELRFSLFDDETDVHCVFRPTLLEERTDSAEDLLVSFFMQRDNGDWEGADLSRAEVEALRDYLTDALEGRLEEPQERRSSAVSQVLVDKKNEDLTRPPCSIFYSADGKKSAILNEGAPDELTLHLGVWDDGGCIICGSPYRNGLPFAHSTCWKFKPTDDQKLKIIVVCRDHSAGRLL